ncbi:hypothetical protein N2152v2_001161 [Parachlorella kessleri]
MAQRTLFDFGIGKPRQHTEQERQGAQQQQQAVGGSGGEQEAAAGSGVYTLLSASLAAGQFGWVDLGNRAAGYAFLFDNSYDLLVCAGLAVLNASQLIVLWVLLYLFLVALSNGLNPGGERRIRVLIAAAAIGLPLVIAWLLAATYAAKGQRQRWAIAVEFLMPVCTAVPLIIIYAGINNRHILAQDHGLAYLIFYSLLFLCSHTAVWWDLRMLSQDFATLKKALSQEGSGTHSDVPLEVLPLVQGAWLRKLGNSNQQQTRRTARRGRGNNGHWRFFQLSHDGSTLRWSWKRFVLLYHVEDIICCDAELTITLSLLLEPDLRLQFPDSQLYQAWQRGLRMLIQLLADPQGLQGGRLRSPRDVVIQVSSITPQSSVSISPGRLLQRLGKSQRACEEDVTQEELQLAAQHARSLLGFETSLGLLHDAQGGSVQEYCPVDGRASSDGGRRPNSFSDPTEFPGAALWPIRTKPGPTKQPKGALGWLKSRVALPAQLLFRSSGSSGERSSPSKQRLTASEEPDSTDPTDGSFSASRPRQLEGEQGSQAGLGLHLNPQARRRFRSISLDLEAAAQQLSKPSSSTGPSAIHLNAWAPPSRTTRRSYSARNPQPETAVGVKVSRKAASLGVAGSVAHSRHSSMAGTLHSRASSNGGKEPSLRNSFLWHQGHQELSSTVSEQSPALPAGEAAGASQPSGNAASVFENPLAWPAQLGQSTVEEASQDPAGFVAAYLAAAAAAQAAAGGSSFAQPDGHGASAERLAEQQQAISLEPGDGICAAAGEGVGRAGSRHHRRGSMGGFHFLPGGDASLGIHPPGQGSVGLEISFAALPGPGQAAYSLQKYPAGPLGDAISFDSEQGLLELAPASDKHAEATGCTAKEAAVAHDPSHQQQPQHLSLPAGLGSAWAVDLQPPPLLLPTPGRRDLSAATSTRSSPRASEAEPAMPKSAFAWESLTTSGDPSCLDGTMPMARGGSGLPPRPSPLGPSGSGRSSPAPSIRNSPAPSGRNSPARSGRNSPAAGSGSSSPARSSSPEPGGSGSFGPSPLQVRAAFPFRPGSTFMGVPLHSDGSGSSSAGAVPFRRIGSAKARLGIPATAAGELLSQGSFVSVQGSLYHGDSDNLSSWGVPSPTSARALSRFNSLGNHYPGLQQAAAAAFAKAGSPKSGSPKVAGSPKAGMAAGQLGVQLAAAQLLPQGHGSANTRTPSSAWENASPSTLSPDTPLSVLRSLNMVVEMIDFQDLTFGKLLGEGSEGAVYAASYLETPVAVKKTQSLMEVEMCLHAGHHDNIVGLRGLCQHENHMYLVMELCPRQVARGTLDVLLHHNSSSKLEPLKLLPIVRSIARGMYHLHTRKPAIMHRDLKPANLFIGHGYVVKIGDFGMSRYADASRGRGKKVGLERTLTPGIIGTAAYCAPEVLNPDSPHSLEAAANPEIMLAADVWSFGVSLWELLERKRPYSGMDGFQVQTQWFLDPEVMRLPAVTMPDNLTPQGQLIMTTLAGLVQQCTEWDPAKRPTFKAVLGVLRGITSTNRSESGGFTPAPSLAAPF